jgi:predicted deacylase
MRSQPEVGTDGAMVRKTASGLRSSIDLERSGKQLGTLWVPNAADNTSGWGNIAIPIGCLRNGDGPTVLVLAGNHGDEYESQLALHRILAETEPDDVRGRLIVIPTLSLPASATGTRLWPDGTNFNRAFPGNPTGSAAAQLAWHLNDVLFPLADIVCDFHTGGRSLAFQPMATLHLVDEPEQRRKMIEAAVAMGTGLVLAYVDVNGGGLLPTAAESQGKVVVSAELGGGGLVTASQVARTVRYIRNVLQHAEVLLAADSGNQPSPLKTTVLRSTSIEDYVLAPASGLYEPLVELGSKVAAGDLLGRIHSLEEADRPAQLVTAQTSGVLAALRAITTTKPGDCVAMIGQESSVSNLLESAPAGA